MFKKYRTIATTGIDNVHRMANARADRVIEREVFTTLKMLEVKNIVTRQD